MKTLLSLLVLNLLVASSAMASENIERQELYSCIINRSFSLVISLDKNMDTGRQAVVLSHKHFLANEVTDVVSLNQPTFIQYGPKFILASNMGKSGYALIRVEHNDKKGLIGLLDINLFPIDDNYKIINGQLDYTHCTKL